MMPPRAENPAAAEATVRLPMWRISACLLGAVKAVVVLALLAAGMFGGKSTIARAAADGWATAIMYTATGAGLAILWMLPPRPIRRWWRPVIAAAGVRVVLSLALALGIFYNVHPHRGFFWGVLGVASFGVLLVEAALFRRILRPSSALAHPALAERADSRAA
jgi:hypothetical protein